MVLLVEDDFAEVGYKDFENLSPSLAVFDGEPGLEFVAGGDINVVARAFTAGDVN